MITRLSNFINSLRQTSAVVLFLAIITTIFMTGPATASEPLSGPSIGMSWWSAQEKTSSAKTTNTSISRQRSLNADIPVPVRFFFAMPFATIRYNDLITDAEFVSDQRLGVGLIHHPAEGDPAWRLDAARVGTANEIPAVTGKFSINLVKLFPWLKLRPSDNVTSWAGVHYAHLPDDQSPGPLKNKSVWIPEFAWIRDSGDGLAVDIVAPRHMYLGIRGHFAAVMAGADQDIRRWAASDAASRARLSPKENKNHPVSSWRMERDWRLKFLVFPSDDLRISASIARDMDPDYNRAGTELSIMWIPNP